MVALTLRLAFVAALLWAQAGFAQTENRPAEVQIKAAFLYKFGDFVQWPPAALARADAPFVIGVLAADDLAGALEQLVANRSVQGHPVAVRRVRRGEPLAGLHVLFIGQAESARLAETLAAARGQAVLTVTESENALAAGSMINFVAEDQRVRFDVALPSAERGQLKISSRLLAVARRVITS
ncbi:MAG TPA: YfiR family protein [Burkholderiales bacterium]